MSWCLNISCWIWSRECLYFQAPSTLKLKQPLPICPFTPGVKRGRLKSSWIFFFLNLDVEQFPLRGDHICSKGIRKFGNQLDNKSFSHPLRWGARQEMRMAGQGLYLEGLQLWVTGVTEAWAVAAWEHTTNTMHNSMADVAGGSRFYLPRIDPTSWYGSAVIQHLVCAKQPLFIPAKDDRSKYLHLHSSFCHSGATVVRESERERGYPWVRGKGGKLQFHQHDSNVAYRETIRYLL